MYLIIHQIFRNIASLSYLITRVVALFAFLFSGYTEGSPVENPTGWTSSIVDSTFNKHTDRYIPNAFGNKGMPEDHKKIDISTNEVDVLCNSALHPNDTNGANYETIY